MPLENFIYFSVLLPFMKKDATVWHPTESTGRFSTLSRGAFSSEKDAHAWAESNGIKPETYSIKTYTL